MPKKLMLFPFGGNAKEAVVSVLALNSVKKEWDLMGFVDDDDSLRGRSSCGFKVLGGREVLGNIPDLYVLAVPGNPDNYVKREAMIRALGIKEKYFAKIIHPSVSIAPDASIGFNTLLMSNVVVGAGAAIGSHCVILPNTVIGHGSVIGDYTCVGANVTVSGGVAIGKNCYIGSSSSLRDNIRVGEKSLVGIGANVIADLGRGVVAAGNPARTIREVAQ